MDEDLNLDTTDEACIAYLLEQVSLLRTFALAVARSHPDPSGLLSSLEQTISEDEDGQIPYSELTPDNQKARRHREVMRDMFLRVVRSRIPP